MLIKPDSRVESALARLRGDSDFQIIVEWFRASQKALDDATRMCQDGILLRQHQGAGQVVADFVARAEGKKAAALTVVDNR